MNALKTALRVLTAVNDNRPPDPFDVHEVFGYAPLLRGMPVDELACAVVRHAIKVLRTC